MKEHINDCILLFILPGQHGKIAHDVSSKLSSFDVWELGNQEANGEARLLGWIFWTLGWEQNIGGDPKLHASWCLMFDSCSFLLPHREGSHIPPNGKRNIFKHALGGDMLVPRRVSELLFIFKFRKSTILSRRGPTAAWQTDFAKLFCLPVYSTWWF